MKPEDIRIELPDDVAEIIGVLEDAGYEAYAVGGCVRDSMLGREPKDWDITTSAQPMEVKKLFKRTVDTGLKHGTVTVMCKSIGYEVTTYRIDGKYTDHRRPESVEFSTDLSEDLLRRDFTINAMAYSERTGIVDMHDGLGDLEKKIIRCVGVADQRFDEDALRIMRAVRFAAELGFDIEENTAKAITGHVNELKMVSAERIETELTKLLLSDHPEKLMIAYESGITGVVLPEFDRMVETAQNNPYHIYDVGRHTIEVIKNVPKDKVMRYAALLHDSGKPVVKTTDEAGVDHFKGHNLESEKIADQVLHRLKMDNDTIRDVKKIVFWHDFGISGNVGIKSFRRAMNKMDISYFDRFIMIRKADIAGQSDYNKDISLENVEKLISMRDEVVESSQCLTIADMRIKGRDLIQQGMTPGPQLGEMLNRLLDEVLEDPELNEYEILLQRAKELMKEGL